MSIVELDKICTEHPVPSGAMYDRLWYYSEKDDMGIRCVVAFRFWQHSKHFHNAHTPEDGWDAECHFEANGRYFHVVTGCREQTPQDVISFFHDLWKKMGCSYAKEWEK